MRISSMSEMLGHSVHYNFTARNEPADLSFLTGRVSDMARQRVGNLGAAGGDTKEDAISVPVRFSQTVKELKKMSAQEKEMQAAADTLAKMKSLASADMSGKKDADKIAAQVEYNALQRRLGEQASRSGLSSLSQEAGKKAPQADVIGQALKAKYGGAETAAAIEAAYNFASSSKEELGKRIDTLYAEGKRLGKTLKSMYS